MNNRQLAAGNADCRQVPKQEDSTSVELSAFLLIHGYLPPLPSLLNAVDLLGV